MFLLAEAPIGAAPVRRVSTKLTSRRTVMERTAQIERPPLIDKPDFMLGVFGRRTPEPVMQPKAEHTSLIVEWLSRQSKTEERSALIRRCQKERPDLFKQWSLVKLFDRSLRLPNTEVAFHIVEGPCNLPGNPPQVVRDRWWTAFSARLDSQTLYMEPYFEEPDNAKAVPLTGDRLRAAVASQWDSLFSRCNRWRWLFNLQHYVAEQMERSRKQREMRASTERYIASLQAREETTRLARRLESGLVDPSDEAKPVRLIQSTPRVQNRQLTLPGGTTAVDAMIARDLQRKLGGRREMKFSEAETLTRRELMIAGALGFLSITVVRAIPSQGYRRLDPLLCLELPESPNVLYLAGHWDEWLVNGVKRTFVHLG